MRVRRGWVVAVAAVLVPVLIVVGVLSVRRGRVRDREFVIPAKPEAPPDLEKLRSAFTSGVDALRRGDGAAAVKDLGSFTFGSRAVEEPRIPSTAPQSPQECPIK